MTMIELEGGTWSRWKRSRHTTAAGYAADCEKYSTAALLGYTVVRLTSDMVGEEWVGRIIAHCRQHSPKTQA